MAEPKTEQEYAEKIHANTRYTGSGPWDTIAHLPCPFCGEPGFMSWKILEVNEVLTQGAVCKYCERGARALIAKGSNGQRMLMYQTEGPDPAPFVRRLPRLPTYDKQAKEWEQIKQEMVDKWMNDGSCQNEAPTAHDVTVEQMKRMASRGEKFLEYDDIMAELQQKTRF